MAAVTQVGGVKFDEPASGSSGLAADVKKQAQAYLAGSPKALSAGKAKTLEKELTLDKAVTYVIHTPPAGNMGGATSKAYIGKNGHLYINVLKTTATDQDVWYDAGMAPKAAGKEQENTLAVQKVLNSAAGKAQVKAAVKAWLSLKGHGESYIDKKYGMGVITLLDAPTSITSEGGNKFTCHCKIDDNELWGGDFEDELNLTVDFSKDPPQVSAQSYKQLKETN